MKFGWPSQGEVKVREKWNRPGQEIVYSYKLVFERNDASGKYTISHRDARVESFNGEAAPTGSENSLMVQSTIVMSGKATKYIVDSGGKLLEIPNFNEMIDEFEKVMKGVPWADAEEEKTSKSIIRSMRSDTGKQMMLALASNEWQALIGEWLGFEAPKGEKKDETSELIIPGADRPLVGKARQINLGNIPANPALLHIKLEQTIDDPKATESMAEMLNKLRESSDDTPLPTGDLPRLTMETISEGHFESTTMKPHWVKLEKIIRMNPMPPELKGKGNETREWWFSWNQK